MRRVGDARPKFPRRSALRPLPEPSMAAFRLMVAALKMCRWIPESKFRYQPVRGSNYG
jgi:hypothetical protein